MGTAAAGSLGTVITAAPHQSRVCGQAAAVGGGCSVPEQPCSRCTTPRSYLASPCRTSPIHVHAHIRGRANPNTTVYTCTHAASRPPNLWDHLHAHAHTWRWVPNTWAPSNVRGYMHMPPWEPCCGFDTHFGSTQVFFFCTPGPRTQLGVGWHLAQLPTLCKGGSGDELEACVQATAAASLRLCHWEGTGCFCLLTAWPPPAWVAQEPISYG